MREEFQIDRNGKQFVLYVGLLDEAHNRGLRSIETTLLQVPSEENGNVAIAKARVFISSERVFEGIGDASPENVGKNIRPHIIRMAETRAKARALRDAVNVSAFLLDEEADDTPTRAQSAGPRGSNSASTSTLNPAEQARLRELIDKTGRSLEKFEETVGSIASVDAETGLGWIRRLARDLGEDEITSESGVTAIRGGARSTTREGE